MVSKLERKSSPEPLLQAEQAAGASLGIFLGKNHRAIRAMRSYNQHLALKEQDKELEEIEKTIEQESKGELHWLNGNLCEISDTGQTILYHGEFFPPGEEERSVRGFRFNFQIDGVAFECVDLDGGRSRKYFDTKDKEGKRKFIKRFAERNGGRLLVADPEKLPLAFTAFIRDTGQGFVIEEIVGYRSFPPRPRKK